MKIQYFMALVVLSLATVPGARAVVLAGPITNAANGHLYYLLRANSMSPVLLGGDYTVTQPAATNQEFFRLKQ